MDSLVSILIIAVLILLNGVFVAAEFAIIGAPRAAIELRAEAGHLAARWVRAILHDPVRQDRYIATAQLGITFASIGLGMYGEHILAAWIHHGLSSLEAPQWLHHALESVHISQWFAAHAIASVLAVSLLTYLHIVLGEMIPKSLALLRAEHTALSVTPLMVWIQILFYPLAVALNSLSNGILLLLGIDRRSASAAQVPSSEELEYVIRESQEGGLLQGEAGDIVRELLDFGELTASRVMVPRVHIVGIPTGATAEEAQAILQSSRHTRYPIYQGDLDHVVGIIHIKVLAPRLIAHQSVDASDARAVPFVPETAPLNSVLAAMGRYRTQIAIVMDEHGGTAGLVTVEDLFQEVVGEIKEDMTQPLNMDCDRPGTLCVSGTTRIEELGEQLAVVLQHQEIDTVSGLILAELGRPAVVADVVAYQGVRFEVTAVEGHGVKECIVSRIACVDGASEMAGHEKGA